MNQRRDRTEAEHAIALIPDPTHTRLDAAILDQKIAGMFRGKDYAYTPVVSDEGWGVGIAVANEDGYVPVLGIDFKDHAEASTFCHGMNNHIDLPPDYATAIVASTMGGFSYRRGL